MRSFAALALCGQMVLTAGLLDQKVLAQSARKLGSVHKVYLSFPSDKPNLNGVKTDLAKDLERSGSVTVVNKESDADAVLTADGDVYVKGYISLNPRAGRSPANGEPIRGGFLSVELKGAGNETLWSFLATPKSGSSRIEQEISRRVTKELITAIRDGKDGVIQDARP